MIKLLIYVLVNLLIWWLMTSPFSTRVGKPIFWRSHWLVQITPIHKTYDLWIGLYIDQRDIIHWKVYYLFLIPIFGYQIHITRNQKEAMP